MFLTPAKARVFLSRGTARRIIASVSRPAGRGVAVLRRFHNRQVLATNRVLLVQPVSLICLQWDNFPNAESQVAGDLSQEARCVDLKAMAAQNRVIGADNESQRSPFTEN